MPARAPAQSEAPPRAGVPAARGVRRLRGALVAATCGVIIALSAALRPEPAGVGTHQQLGLPACSAINQSGYPCPTCGMTTAMAATAHGRFGLALQAQPAGVALFLLAAVAGLIGMAELVAGWNVLDRYEFRLWHVALAVGVLLAGWCVKICIGFADGTLPHR